MKKVLSVAAIENGTVIDHIPAGQALKIADFLKLSGRKLKVTIGLSLPSKSMGYKDLIKVEGWEISEEEAQNLTVFAPHATLSIIRGYQLLKKFSPMMPENIEKVISCPNSNCVTHAERLPTRFSLRRYGNHIEVTCYFCEKSFAHDTV